MITIDIRLCIIHGNQDYIVRIGDEYYEMSPEADQPNGVNILLGNEYVDFEKLAKPDTFPLGLVKGITSRAIDYGAFLAQRNPEL